MFDTPLFANISSGMVTVGADVELTEINERLDALGWSVRDVDGAAIVDKDQLISAIAEALSFPDWTGRNWDALSDAVTDLSWVNADRIALVVHNSDALADSAPAEWRVAKDILSEAVEWWTDRSRALLVVLA